jgi:phosphoglycerate dehydrogenase-like enzyme
MAIMYETSPPSATPYFLRPRFSSPDSGAEVLVAPPLTEAQLEKAHRLRLHVIPFAGVDRVPLSWYRERGIALASSHGNAPVVAERAVALAYAAAGRVVEFDGDLRRGLWHRNRSSSRPFDFWHSLRGVPTALLGAGAIAKECARLLRPLVGEIRALSRSSSGRNPEPFDSVTTDLTVAVRGAGLIIAALPLTTETRGLLGRRHFQAAENPVFVNVSRAAIVEEKTLFSVLSEGIVSAAGLDVWYRYPDPFWAEQMPSHLPFEELPNVVLSPHAASHAEEGKLGQFQGALRIVDRYLRDGSLPDGVDVEQGY